MYGSKIIKVYLFTYICKLLKCISIESRTNQWSEMEHTNYENQVYLLLLFIFIIQTYIPLFLFLLLKLSTNMFLIVCLTSIGPPMEAALEIKLLSAFWVDISFAFVQVYSCTSGWPSQRNDSLQPHRFINDNINSRCNTNISALLRTSWAFIDKPMRLSASPEAPRSTGTRSNG